MNKLLLIALIAVSANIAALGQKTISKGPAATYKPLKAAPAGFTRERFDPKRDPALNLAAALETAARTSKRVILDVGGEWCGWCVYMDKFFFQNPALAKLRDDNFVWVKVNFSDENENRAFLAQYPVPTGYPHLYILDGSGKLIQSQDTSYLEAGNGYNIKKFRAFLKRWSPVPANPIV